MGTIELLTDLTEYVEEVTRLTIRPVLRSSQYKDLFLHEADLLDRPGISIDVNLEDPVWLEIDRLVSRDPPHPPSEIKGWITVASDPSREPHREDFIAVTLPLDEAQKLVAIGRVRSEDVHSDSERGGNGQAEDQNVDVILRLEAFPEIKTRIDKYVSEPWNDWAKQEVPKRETIKIYHKLFALQQSIESGTGRMPLEVIWGIGIMRWKNPKMGLIDHPLIEMPVEIDINKLNSKISVRPLEKSPRIAEALLGSLTGDGIINFINTTKNLIKELMAGGEEITPFEKETFESILRNCATQIDQEGIFWPDKSENVEDRSAPNAESNLIITDTWAIYARPRNENFIVEDIKAQREALKEKHSRGEDLPRIAKSLVRSTSQDGDPPSIGPANGPIVDPPNPAPVQTFYLPKAVNKDQIEILRKLETQRKDGVVVQGPPGTGKTHTIANLICHFMATGRRVLVCSHTEGALAVLRDQIPESVRGLAVSLLFNERQGSDQLEEAVRLIERETSKNTPSQLASDIEEEANLASRLRQSIASIDNKFRDIANRHLKQLGGQEKRTWEWAKWVVEGTQQHSWLPDQIRSKQNPQFTNEQVTQLKRARSELGNDLIHLKDELPPVDDLPDAATLAGVHKDILTLERLTDRQQGGDLPTLSTQQPDAQSLAVTCKRALDALISAFHAIDEFEWLRPYLDMGTSSSIDQTLIKHIDDLFNELEGLVQRHSTLLGIAINVPQEIFEYGLFDKIFNALDRISEGYSPFPLINFNPSAKEYFHQITINGELIDSSDKSVATKVKNHIKWHRDLNKFVAKWNQSSQQLNLPTLDPNRYDLVQWLYSVVDPIDRIRGVKGHSIETLKIEIPKLFPGGIDPTDLFASENAAQAALEAISANLAMYRLSDAVGTVTKVRETLRQHSGALVSKMKNFVSSKIGDQKFSALEITNDWNDLLTELARQKGLDRNFRIVQATARAIKNSGAPKWAQKLEKEVVKGTGDPLCPNHWRESWKWRQWDTYLRSINQSSRIHQLSEKRHDATKKLQDSIENEVKLRTISRLCEHLTNEMRTDLATVVTLLSNAGTGQGQQAKIDRKNARIAMQRCYSAIPCWIMPAWRASDMLPPDPGSFDLVIIDEASQSDIRELPVLLRGQNVLIVGDDKQVSPSAIGITIQKQQILFNRYLKNLQLGSLMTPGFSLYDLFLSVFAGQKIMLHEHFRCAEPIIRFSFQFYTEDINPLRIPTASERLDPPLVDIYVKYGFKEPNKTNPAEAHVIVDEISKIIADPSYSNRSIGVVSLLGQHQSAYIEQQLLKSIGEEAFLEHSIVCGDAATFQGKERDIMFVSMIAAPNDFRRVTAKPYQQRFNVALSRAKDRMYLVRSLDLNELDPADLKAKVIQHFKHPMIEEDQDGGDPRKLLESSLEQAIYDRLIALGYRVRPQVRVGDFRIDLVVEGDGDRRLAIEMDGDRWHGPDKWWSDYTRQQTLERMGWIFWRCWGSVWQLDPDGCMSDLVTVLESLNIQPMAGPVAAYRYTEHRVLDEPSVDAVKDEDYEGFDYTIDVGDTVEIEISDAEPPERLTYVVDPEKNDVAMGIVRADGEIGHLFVNSAIGDEFELPIDGGKMCSIVGIFKGGGAAAEEHPSTQPLPPDETTQPSQLLH